MCNIREIVENDLCCSCHACTSICPANAINKIYCKGMYIPQVDNALCIKCGKCLKVCPSYQVDIVPTYNTLDLQKIMYKQSYIAYALQEEIRELSASGGIVTAMVRYLIQNQIYKKAYLLDYENFDGQAVLKSYIDYNDIIKTVKSKYVPASIENVVNDIKLRKISNSIIVGTPCQILAIKRTMKLHNIDEETVLFIGLFCDKTLNYNIYRYYENKCGKFSTFHFKDKKAGGWPGNTLIKQNEKEIIIDKIIRMRLKEYFQLNRCRYCIDKLNQLSDISVGDCYISGFEHPSGLSNIIVRTSQGEKALKVCESILHIETCSVDDIKFSQHVNNRRMNLLRSAHLKRVYTNIPLSLCNGMYFDLKNERDEYSMLTLGANLYKYTNNKSIDEHMKRKQHKSHMGKIKRLLLFIKRLCFEKDNSYKVYIDNAGFVNKGDQLMIESIVEQVRKWKPDSVILLKRSAFYQNVSYCYKNKILPLQESCGRFQKFKMKLAFDVILNKRFYVTPDKVDLVLNARGYFVGDKWNISDQDIKYYEMEYMSFCKKGRKIIMLPQAFGPFSQENSVKLMKSVYKYADLIYARDEVSYRGIIDVIGESSKIKIAPDFTIMLKPNKETISVYPPEKQYVVIIVNCRMIDKTDLKVANNYKAFILEIIRHLETLGEKVVLLNHEGYGDEELMLEINKIFDNKIPVFSKFSGIDVKAIIGHSKLTISSRYHGVVSGLVQNVPTLCTSWSHKYEELLKEHGCEKNILSITAIEESKEIVSDALDNPCKYISKSGCNERIKDNVRNMWEEIFYIVNN